MYSILFEKVDGIEAFSPYHSKADMYYYLTIAEQYNLLVTCGSDFHGKHKPNIKLGGHGAMWSDQKVLAELEERLLKM